MRSNQFVVSTEADLDTALRRRWEARFSNRRDAVKLRLCRMLTIAAVVCGCLAGAQALAQNA